MTCIFHVISLDLHHSNNKRSLLTGCPPLEQVPQVGSIVSQAIGYIVGIGYIDGVGYIVGVGIFGSIDGH